MTNQFQQFKELHQQEELLLIGNVWDVQSAKVFEGQGFKAIATSSAAVAETLGYADGEQMNFDEYLFIIQHIAAAVPLPLSVDLETGYATTVAGIVENIKELSKLGVCGINIEDSFIKDGTRTIAEAGPFAEKIKAIMAELSKAGIDIFVNLRSDPFLLGLPDPLAEAEKRISLYQTTGVHGLFFPCVTSIENILVLTESSSLPVNVMCMPSLPGFAALQKAGVKRVSMGNFLNKKIYKSLQAEVDTIVRNQGFDSLF